MNRRNMIKAMMGKKYFDVVIPDEFLLFECDEDMFIGPGSHILPDDVTLYYSVDEKKTWHKMSNLSREMPSSGHANSVYGSKRIFVFGISQTSTGIVRNDLISYNDYWSPWYMESQNGTEFRVYGDVMSLVLNHDGSKKTTLVEHGFSHMFINNTKLVQAPSLSATTLTKNCYLRMFKGCTSLVNAPELPATTLAESCYQDMFRDCTSLTTAPELPATTLAEYCYISMFYDCTSLVNAPELPATTLKSRCYWYMFNGCTSLSEVKLAYTGADNSFTTWWLDNVSPTGTLYKAGTQFSSSYSGTYPDGWTQVPWTP